MSDAWHYADGGKSVGPLTLAELGVVLRRARDPKTISVWQDGFAKWEKAGDVQALAAYMIRPPADLLAGSPMAQTSAGTSFDDYAGIVRDCMGSKFADFKGRAPRKEFWTFFVFTFLVSLAASLIGEILGFGQSRALELLVALVFIIPSLAVSCRRLHDTDRRGWWQLLFPIPIIGFVVLIIFWCLRGTLGDNRFGPDPYAGAEPVPSA